MAKQIEIPGAALPRGPGEENARPAEIVASLASATFGTADSQLYNRLLGQLGMAMAGDVDLKDVADVIRPALGFLADMQPRSPAEAMQLIHMFIANEVVMGSFCRANDPDKSDQVRDMNLKQVAKFMSLYQSLFAAFEKRRGCGQQKITVEHVTVEAGGQAIVGSVTAGEGGGRRGRRSPQAAVPSGDGDAPDFGELKPATPPRKTREPKR